MASKPPLPAPLVSPLRHPLKWIWISVLSLAIAVVIAHVGTLDITGLYYAVLEWNSKMTHLWHALITNNTLRHSIRDVAEGFYGGAIAQQLVWNHFRHRRLKSMERPMNRLDRIEVALGIPNLRSGKPLRFWQIPYTLLLWAPVYGAVGFTAAYLLRDALAHSLTILQHTAVTLGPHSSLWQRAATIDTASWDYKVMGFAASLFFGRRPLRKVFDGVQLWFAERHVASGKPLHWYYPPTFRARCNDVAEKVRAGTIVARDRFARLQDGLLIFAVVAVVVFAGLGYYVLTVIAVRPHG